jgi:hypothetical protein
MCSDRQNKKCFEKSRPCGDACLNFDGNKNLGHERQFLDEYAKKLASFSVSAVKCREMAEDIVAAFLLSRGGNGVSVHMATACQACGIDSDAESLLAFLRK